MATPTKPTPRQLLEEAMRERQLGHPQNAENFCRLAIADDPEFADAWNLLGMARRDMNDLPGAMQAITRACNLGAIPEYFINLGDCYRVLNQHDTAMECFRRALRLKPDHTLALLSLGNLLLMSQRSADAAEVFRKALKASPCSGEGHYGLGIAMMRLDHPAGAAESFLQAVEISPWEARYWFELGEARRRTQQPGGAMECYRRALLIDPSHAIARNRMMEQR